MQEFIDFVEEIFPSISPYTAEKAKECLKQFNLNETYCSLTKSTLGSLVQADIIGEIPFDFYNKEGVRVSGRHNGIILSSSCDIENDDYITISPLLPISEIKNDGIESSIKKNIVLDKLYLPEQIEELKEFYADFSIIQTFPKTMIIQALDETRIKKIGSLTQLAYYLFICKLTIHFLRPEDITIQSLRTEKC